MTILCVGAGFSGAVIARHLAEAGHPVTVIDRRPHVAGNCHTDRDAQTGIMVHRYGPHIFHTDDAEIWAYMQRFGAMQPYRNQVKATVHGRVYTLPINLHTINQFFGKSLTPTEAQAFLAARAERGPQPPQSFEEQALHFVGRELYEAFFKGYTQKQWGCAPSDLPASVLKRLPLRFNYDDNYFAHRFQGIPQEGYSALVTRILDHPRITLRLGCAYDPSMRAEHLFWSGPLDAYFGSDLGSLGYRSLRFEEIRTTGDWQGCAVMNYPDGDIPYTRITEHKHFAPWENHGNTLVFKEYSKPCQSGDTPYYPIRLLREKALLAQYEARARSLPGVTFVGRLGTYRYLDMDVTIREALDTAELFVQSKRQGRPMPAFYEPFALGKAA